jgi:hypothetical protein
VQIDPRVRRILPGRWQTEYDRPIYFIELRDGYCCAWCEMDNQHLLLLPHPLSPAKIRRIAYGVEGEIIGQVTGAGISFTEPDHSLPSLRPPKKI